MRLARWVQRHDRAGRIDARPNQEAGLAERLGLSRDEIGRAVWTIEPGGSKFEGAAAISRTLRELGGGWGVLGAFYFFPPVRWLQDTFYSRSSRPLDRRIVFSHADAHVLGPVANLHVTVRVHHRGIAGMEPSIAHHFLRRLGVLVVALHDDVALDDDLAQLLAVHGHILT